MTREELKTCPFCGYRPHIRLDKKRGCQLHGDIIQDVIVECPNKCASFQKINRKFAIEAWNKRVQEV